MSDEIKCPHCEDYISSLDYDVTGGCSSQFTIEEAKKGYSARGVYDSDSLMENISVNNFRCPECDETICDTEEEAIKFLKGGIIIPKDCNLSKEKELASSIIGEFEELLGRYNIKIPDRDREEINEEDEACIYGMNYYTLEDAITDMLKEKLK